MRSSAVRRGGKASLSRIYPWSSNALLTYWIASNQGPSLACMHDRRTAATRDVTKSAPPWRRGSTWSIWETESAHGRRSERRHLRRRNGGRDATRHTVSAVWNWCLGDRAFHTTPSTPLWYTYALPPTPASLTAVGGCPFFIVRNRKQQNDERTIKLHVKVNVFSRSTATSHIRLTKDIPHRRELLGRDDIYIYTYI